MLVERREAGLVPRLGSVFCIRRSDLSFIAGTDFLELAAINRTCRYIAETGL